MLSNLTEISISVRKLFVWLIIVFIGYFILKIFFDISKEYFKPLTRPPPVILPDVKFGKIPAPKFTTIIISSSGLQFTLVNKEGKPPEASTTAKVYRIPKKSLSLGSAERAKNLAARLGFTDNPYSNDPSNYLFTDTDNPLRTLSLDVVNLNFKLKYDYQKASFIGDNIFDASDEKITKDSQRVQQITAEVRNYIQKNGLFDDAVLGETFADLLTFDSKTKQFINSADILRVNAVRINFFRKNIENYKIVPPSFFQSFNYVIYVSTSSATLIYPEISYTYRPVAEDDFSIYPLLTSHEAWQDLIDGYATVVNMGNNSPQKIIIRDIYLVYYDTEEPQYYLQPIFVFEGDNEFAAFLPAIRKEYLE